MKDIKNLEDYVRRKAYGLPTSTILIDILTTQPIVNS